METTKIICLTPVKNEAWILEKFLSATSMWADHIIIADQNSDDRSREIAKSFKKVTLVLNPSAEFNEPERQKILINEARKISGKKILIALDADEFLSGNFSTSSEWQKIRLLEEGTVLKFRWANIHPDLKHYWLSAHFPWGIIDDGSTHNGKYIHSPRIPLPEKPKDEVEMKDVFVMHFQYTDWDRMLSKQRWYQCLERIKNPRRNAWSIYRQYHHMSNLSSEKLNAIPTSWFTLYDSSHIYLLKIRKNTSYWWDKEVLGFLKKYGTSFFRREDIWNIDWNKKAEQISLINETFTDPRTAYDRFRQNIFSATQPFFNSKYFITLKATVKKIKTT